MGYVSFREDKHIDFRCFESLCHSQMGQPDSRPSVLVVLRFTCFGTSHGFMPFGGSPYVFFEIQWDGRSHVYVQSNYVNT